jgi:phosphate transport system substrate-binding protein
LRIVSGKTGQRVVFTQSSPEVLAAGGRQSKATLLSFARRSILDRTPAGDPAGMSIFETPTHRRALRCGAAVWALATVTCLIGLSGCDSGSKDSPVAGKQSGESAGGEGDSAGSASLTGTIKINGSSTVQPISNAVKERFAELYPNVTVEVDGAGTGNGFKDFQSKSTDISDASRPIKPGEFEKCRENGVAFIELPVAYDGLTIAIHPDNDWATRLTVEQLRKIFVGQDAPKKWNEVNPEWPDENINIYAPGTGSGTYDYFREVVVGESEAELRNDMNLSEDDNVLVQGVAGNKYSIGFFGVAYYNESKDELRAIEIVNPEDGNAYLPTTENIANNKYAPFSRPLFIYVSTASLPRAEVTTFVTYYLDNVSELCEKVGYVRLPEDLLQKSKDNLDSEVTGTHFVDGEGNSQTGSLVDRFQAKNLTPFAPTK